MTPRQFDREPCPCCGRNDSTLRAVLVPSGAEEWTCDKCHAHNGCGKCTGRFVVYADRDGDAD